MKYCPFCGAALLGGAASFCAECGKQVQKVPQPEPESIKRQAKAPTTSRLVGRLGKRTPKQTDQSRKRQSHPESNLQDDGYDGYYDDVQPLDDGHEREGLDTEMVKKILMVLGSAVCIIVLSLVIMRIL